MLPIFAKAPCCLELFGCCCRRLSQHGLGEVLILRRHCWPDAFFCVCVGSGPFCHDWASHCSVLFSSFDALFVGLPLPSSLWTPNAYKRALCTLGTDPDQNSKSFRGDDGRTLVVTCLGTPSPRWTKNLKRLVSTIETENLKNLKTAVHLVNCIIN